MSIDAERRSLARRADDGDEEARIALSRLEARSGQSRTRREWVIVRKSDGLRSCGGSYPKFNKNGRVWTRRGDLESHLTYVAKDVAQYGRANPYVGCEILEFEITEAIVSVRQADEAVAEKAKKGRS